MKFYIYSPKYQSNVGGIRVLHKLNYLLNNLNVNSQIVYFGSEINLSNEVESFAVYPEIVEGNPLKAKFVVRWLLNTVGQIAGDENTWNDGDLIYNFMDSFTCKNADRIIRKLTILDIDWQSIYNVMDNEKIFECCHLIKKGKYYFTNFTLHPKNSIELDFISNDYEKTIEMISKSKKFISYDNETFYSLIAPMLGTISIIIPKDDKSQLEFCSLEPIAKFGISYGLGNEDYSKSTMHVTVDFIKTFENNNLTEAKSLIMDCNNFLKINFLRESSQKLKQKIFDLENLITNYEKIEKELINLKLSYSLKIGKLITYPIRIIYDFINLKKYGSKSRNDQ